MVELSQACVVALALGWAAAAVLLMLMVLRAVRLWEAEQACDWWEGIAGKWKETADRWRELYFDQLAGKGLSRPLDTPEWLADDHEQDYRSN